LPEDTYLSGLHFQVEWRDDGCVVRDLGSTNGTFVNGSRITEFLLRGGENITAGQTTFSVEIEGPPDEVFPPTQEISADVPFPALEVSARFSATSAFPGFENSVTNTHTPPPLTALEQRLHEKLRTLPEPLYAILDAARDPDVLSPLRAFGDEFQSLLDPAQAEQLNFAPLLVKIPFQSRLLDELIRHGWGKNWGIYFTSSYPFEDVRHHFRRFLTVRTEDGVQQLAFRFYDPRILRVYLPTLTVEEARQFFGPVRWFLMEADRPDVLLHFAVTLTGVSRQELALGKPENRDMQQAAPPGY
jgi:hypothetical protein